MENCPRFSPHELQKFAIVEGGKLGNEPPAYQGEAWALGTSTLISRLISTEEAHFYGGGLFLRRRLISTEEAYFYGGGSFLRRRLISTEEDHFYGGGSFLRRRLISIVGSFVGRRSVSMQQPHLSAEIKTHRTEQASFNTERTFFSSV